MRGFGLRGEWDLQHAVAVEIPGEGESRPSPVVPAFPGIEEYGCIHRRFRRLPKGRHGRRVCFPHQGRDAEVAPMKSAPTPAPSRKERHRPQTARPPPGPELRSTPEEGSWRCKRAAASPGNRNRSGAFRVANHTTAESTCGCGARTRPAPGPNPAMYRVQRHRCH